MQPRSRRPGSARGVRRRNNRPKLQTEAQGALAPEKTTQKLRSAQECRTGYITSFAFTLLRRKKPEEKKEHTNTGVLRILPMRAAAGHLASRTRMTRAVLLLLLAVASAPAPPARCPASCKISCVMPRCGTPECCEVHGSPQRADVLFPFEAQDTAVYALVSTPQLSLNARFRHDTPASGVGGGPRHACITSLYVNARADGSVVRLAYKAASARRASVTTETQNSTKAARSTMVLGEPKSSRVQVGELQVHLTGRDDDAVLTVSNRAFIVRALSSPALASSGFGRQLNISIGLKPGYVPWPRATSGPAPDGLLVAAATTLVSEGHLASSDGSVDDDHRRAKRASDTLQAALHRLLAGNIGLGDTAADYRIAQADPTSPTFKFSSLGGNASASAQFQHQSSVTPPRAGGTVLGGRRRFHRQDRLRNATRRQYRRQRRAALHRQHQANETSALRAAALPPTATQISIEVRCRKKCTARNQCCSKDVAQSTNQFPSCLQSCVMRALGTDRQTCSTLCSEQSCWHTTGSGARYHMCSDGCSDSGSGCQMPQLHGCLVGCSLGASAVRD